MRHFQAWELVDRQTYETHGDSALMLFSPSLLVALDDLRDYFDAPVTVNTWRWHLDVPENLWEERNIFQWRGWRTPEKAAELGAPHSQHALGRAVDCDIEGCSPEYARKLILADKDNPKLCRIMRLEASVPWLHFDVCPVSERILVFYS